jgi:hypothetical protein
MTLFSCQRLRAHQELINNTIPLLGLFQHQAKGDKALKLYNRLKDLLNPPEEIIRFPANNRNKNIKQDKVVLVCRYQT